MVWIFFYIFFFIPVDDIIVIRGRDIIRGGSIHSLFTGISVGLEGMNSVKVFAQVSIHIIVAKSITLVQVIAQARASGTLLFTTTFFTVSSYLGDSVSWKVVS